jgi:glycosyltransferase involved in cell wall biosynthesis
VRFHVPALPGRPTARENSTCAYSGYIRKLCRMMHERGHHVILYANGPVGVEVSEFVACYPILDEPLPFNEPERWADCNDRAADAINARAEPGDFLCLTAGEQRAIAEAVPLMAVEQRVGYAGTFTEHRVFETYAWMHAVYGQQQGAMSANGLCYDAVIYPPFEVEDFPEGGGGVLGRGEGDYLLYLGRMVERKGCRVAAQIAEALDARLILAGEGPDVPDYGEHIGNVGPDQRAALLGGARALLAPTTYLEPGGGAAIEAQLCGTPVLSTDWGCYTETVEQGVTGCRCRTLGEFLWAAGAVGELDRAAIRERAIARHSLEAIGPQYERYFERLGTLYGKGWYERGVRVGPWARSMGASARRIESGV